jgi:hypothetical protein
VNGRELLEALQAMTPEELEREVVAEYSVPDGYTSEYVQDTLVRLEHVPARDVLLIRGDRAWDAMVPVIVIR